jgi:DNA-binding XRE family transcriptional regulator
MLATVACTKSWPLPGPKSVPEFARPVAQGSYPPASQNVKKAPGKPSGSPRAVDRRNHQRRGYPLKQLREAAGLSQSQLAKAAGVPVGSIQGWEQGRRTPLLDAPARVAVAMGVSLDELAGINTAPARKPKGK